MDKAVCLPWMVEMNNSERSHIGSQDTPKLFPAGSSISEADTVIHPVGQARNLGVSLDFSPSPQSLVVASVF